MRGLTASGETADQLDVLYQAVIDGTEQDNTARDIEAEINRSKTALIAELAK